MRGFSYAASCAVSCLTRTRSGAAPSSARAFNTCGVGRRFLIAAFQVFRDSPVRFARSTAV
nr:MAG TPA: hypothetical protein [Caudoviricetes sp.]